MNKFNSKLFLILMVASTCATTGAMQQFFSQAYRKYIKRIPDNAWIQIVQSWPLKENEFSSFMQDVKRIAQLINEKNQLQIPLELAQLAQENSDQVTHILADLEKENRDAAESLKNLIKNPQELQKVLQSYYALLDEIQRYNINGISPIYEKTPLQYALINENYEAALGLIQVSEALKKLFMSQQQQGQEQNDPQIVPLLQLLSINPLAPSPSGRTTLEYAFLTLEKNIRPSKIAYHLEKPDNTVNKIMNYLCQAFSHLEVPREEVQEAQKKQEDAIRESISTQIKHIVAALKQQFESMNTRIKGNVLHLQQGIQQHQYFYEKAPQEYKTHIEQLMRTQNVIQIIISKLTCIEQNRNTITSLPKLMIAYRLIESLLESKLLEHTNKANLILLKHWFTYYCLLISPHTP